MLKTAENSRFLCFEHFLCPRCDWLVRIIIADNGKMEYSIMAGKIVARGDKAIE